MNFVARHVVFLDSAKVCLNKRFLSYEHLLSHKIRPYVVVLAIPE
jgi:hypothetical protein